MVWSVRRILFGKTKLEVQAMLGPPSADGYFKDAGLVYLLGPERRFLGIDSEWLRIDFDRAGLASEVRVVTD